MIGNDWDKILKPIVDTKEFKTLMKKVKEEYKNNICYPEYNNIFSSLKITPYENIKVVLLGQDPYHEKNQAHGLSFSVENDKLPPSLKNIFKELQNDLGICNNIGNLTSWAQEGILLLNSILTVEEHKALSHKDLGWQVFTDYIIKEVNKIDRPIVFLLFGEAAKSKKYLITNKKHLIIECSHPSPFSVYKGFYGSKCFSRTNNFLNKNNIKEIDFSIKH
ncbi:MAG: uracil-DNA glycosylase [Bacilli bacterium]